MSRPKNGRVTYPVMDFEKRGERHRKNHGLNPRGWEHWHETDCPCSVCGHTKQEECDAAMCDCCSSYCT